MNGKKKSINLGNIYVYRLNIVVQKLSKKKKTRRSGSNQKEKREKVLQVLKTFDHKLLKILEENSTKLTKRERESIEYNSYHQNNRLNPRFIDKKTQKKSKTYQTAKNSKKRGSSLKNRSRCQTEKASSSPKVSFKKYSRPSSARIKRKSSRRDISNTKRRINLDQSIGYISAKNQQLHRERKSIFSTNGTENRSSYRPSLLEGTDESKRRKFEGVPIDNISIRKIRTGRHNRKGSGSSGGYQILKDRQVLNSDQIFRKGFHRRRARGGRWQTQGSTADSNRFLDFSNYSNNSQQSTLDAVGIMGTMHIHKNLFKERREKKRSSRKRIKGYMFGYDQESQQEQE